MNELDAKRYQLPANIEDLAKFVLVGREKLASVRAEIRAIEKVGLAREVYEQKREELNLLSGALLDAEVRLGDLMKEIPKPGAGRPPKTIDNAVGNFPKTKSETLAELGFHQKQAERFEALANNKKVVEITKFQAQQEQKPVTRDRALKAARFVKGLPPEQQQEIKALPVEQAAEKLSELYNAGLVADVESGSDIDFGLNELYGIPFTPETIKGYADGCVSDWEFELNRLDELIKNLIRLRKALEERSRF